MKTLWHGTACLSAIACLQVVIGCSHQKEAAPDPAREAVTPTSKPSPLPIAREDGRAVVLATVGQPLPPSPPPPAKAPAWQPRAEAAAQSINGTNAKQLLEIVADVSTPVGDCYEALAYYAMTQMLAADYKRDRCLPKLDGPVRAEWQVRLSSGREAASPNFNDMLQKAVLDGCSKAVANYPGGVGTCRTCIKIPQFQADLSNSTKHIDSAKAQTRLRSTKIEIRPLQLEKIER